MSVPSWERELAKTQFVHEAYRLCVDIGHIVACYPKKYKSSYGDMLIRDSLECLKYCRLANSIFMSTKTTEDDYQLRKRYLIQARLLSYHIATEADIFLSLCYNLDGVKKDKVERHQRRIGSYASSIRNLIGGVLKSDRDIRAKKA